MLIWRFYSTCIEWHVVQFIQKVFVNITTVYWNRNYFFFLLTWLIKNSNIQLYYVKFQTIIVSVVVPIISASWKTIGALRSTLCTGTKPCCQWSTYWWSRSTITKTIRVKTKANLQSMKMTWLYINTFLFHM